MIDALFSIKLHISTGVLSSLLSFVAAFCLLLSAFVIDLLLIFFFIVVLFGLKNVNGTFLSPWPVVSSQGQTQLNLMRENLLGLCKALVTA